MSDKVHLRSPEVLCFWCPGCGHAHCVWVADRVGNSPKWTWNGSISAPTIKPSLDVTGICHSYVTDGRIQFLKDSTHDLAGQTVDLPDWREGDSTD